jgi:hypothetical protein
MAFPKNNGSASTWRRALAAVGCIAVLGGCAHGIDGASRDLSASSDGPGDVWSKAYPTAEERRSGGGIPGSD